MEEQRKRSEKRRRETSRRKQWRKWKGGLRQQAFLHRAISRSHLAINLIAFLSASILPLCAPLFTFPWLDAQDLQFFFGLRLTLDLSPMIFCLSATECCVFSATPSIFVFVFIFTAQTCCIVVHTIACLSCAVFRFRFNITG